MILRVLAAAAVASALFPAVSSAAVTRPVQAFDTPTFRTIYTPKNVPAQVGDTIEWRLTQPGNSRAATHDLWLVAPGASTGVQLGASYLNPKPTAVVDTVGTYQFYCSIHGGLAPGGMNGKVVVGTADPGAPVDPGTPWTDPDWQDPDYPDDGPAPLPNQTTAPTVFEEGDVTPPTLDLVKVTETDKAAKVKVDVSEPGWLTLQLKRNKRVVAVSRVEIAAGRSTATIKPPKNLRNKLRRYRLQAWSTDEAEIDSEIHAVWVDLGR